MRRPPTEPLAARRAKRLAEAGVSRGFQQPRPILSRRSARQKRPQAAVIPSKLFKRRLKTSPLAAWRSKRLAETGSSRGFPRAGPRLSRRSARQKRPQAAAIPSNVSKRRIQADKTRVCRPAIGLGAGFGDGIWAPTRRRSSRHLAPSAPSARPATGDMNVTPNGDTRVTGPVTWLTLDR